MSTKVRPAAEVAAEAEERLGGKVWAAGIPERMVGGIVRYVMDGKDPGGFLLAVFRNDMVEAFARGDSENQQIMGRYATVLYNHVPAKCWGSEEKVRAWMEVKGLRGWWENGSVLNLPKVTQNLKATE